MSLSSTATIKGQLQAQLGPKSQLYFDTLAQFVAGRISRLEFDDTIKPMLEEQSLSA
jgi:hypothetical protein